MKRFPKILLIFFICSFCAVPYSNAQFWKKIFKNEHRKRDKEKHKTKHEKPNTVLLKKKTVPDYPNSIKKNNYRIDVLLPLHLNELVKNGKAIYKTQPDKVLPTIHFYEGLKIAINQLNEKGYHLDLFIHDITNPTDNIPHLLSNPSFDTTNLIIGLLQSENIPKVAAFSKKNHINFLSALSPSDAEIKDNPYFLMVQPTLSTHIQKLMDYALNRYLREPKFLFYQDNTGVQKEAFNQLVTQLKNEVYTKVQCSKTMMNKDSLIKIFDSTEVNVIFINLFDPSLVQPILKTLSSLGASYHFAIFGMPSWKILPDLNQPGTYPNMSIYFTNPFYFEPDTRPGEYVSTIYKKKYNGTPSEMVYRGYETLIWMVNLLEKYGTVFNEHIEDISASPFTRYKIKYIWSPDNDFLFLENQNLNIYKYQNGYFKVN